MTLKDAITGAEAVLGRTLTLNEVAQLGEIVETNPTWEAIFKFFGQETAPAKIVDRMIDLRRNDG